MVKCIYCNKHTIYATRCESHKRHERECKQSKEYHKKKYKDKYQERERGLKRRLKQIKEQTIINITNNTMINNSYSYINVYSEDVNKALTEASDANYEFINNIEKIKRIVHKVIDHDHILKMEFDNYDNPNHERANKFVRDLLGKFKQVVAQNNNKSLVEELDVIIDDIAKPPKALEYDP
ncbi:coiled coils domain protein [Faustovirus]|nr:coiled coils domain protein [Faustovirus]QJX73510.1 coiled coils domain protein [Faustovirus]